MCETESWFLRDRQNRQRVIQACERCHCAQLRSQEPQQRLLLILHRKTGHRARLSAGTREVSAVPEQGERGDPALHFARPPPDPAAKGGFGTAGRAGARQRGPSTPPGKPRKGDRAPRRSPAASGRSDRGERRAASSGTAAAAAARRCGRSGHCGRQKAA